VLPSQPGQAARSAIFFLVRGICGGRCIGEHRGAVRRVNKVAALFGDCETATAGVEETLMGMTSAAGHPGLVAALSAFGESSTRALVGTGRVLTFIAAGLKQNATDYGKTESTNAHNLTAAGSKRPQ
jgi:hypothetical protein